MSEPPFWYKLFNSPTAVFEYDEFEREIYETTKKSLKETLEAYYLECDDEKLRLIVWRKR